MAGERPRALLPILLSVVIVDLIGFGIVVPVLPFYARAYGANGLVLGLLLTSYAAMQLVFAPIWGRLSDRIGRRPVMLLTIGGTAASLVLLGLSDSLVWLFAARLLGGAFAANISVATAFIADVTEPEERTRWMGLIGAAFAVGFLVGPALGGLLAPQQTATGPRFLLLGPALEEALSPFGYGLPMLAAAGLALVNLGWAAARLPEPNVHRPREAAAGERAQVLRDPLVRRICAVYLLFSLAVSQLESIFAFLMLDRFGYDAREVAWILVGMAVAMGTIQGGAIRPLAARFGERSLLLAGSVMLAVGFAGVPFSASVAVLLLPLGVCAVGRAIAHPSLLSMVSFAADEGRRGVVMGTFQSSASLARVVGPLAAGASYDLFADAPFFLASALMVGAAALGVGLPAAAGEEPALAAEPTLD